MLKENNKMQVDIDTLKKQNVNDLLSIKELYSKLEELGEKITQTKYIDNTIVKKLKKEYEKLEKIILDENIQVKLNNDIETINTQLNNDIKTINTHLDAIVNKVEVFPSDFGAKGDGVADDTMALQNAINYCQNNNVKLKSQQNKVYLVTSKLFITKKINMDLNCCVIKASDNVTDIIDISTGQIWYGKIRNIVLDCNNTSSNGFTVSYGEKLSINNLVVKNCKKICFSVKGGYEVICKDSHFNGVETNSIGMKIDTSDCHFSDIILIDCYKAIVTSDTTNYYNRIHAWMRNNELVGSTFFTLDGGNNFITDCFSDSYNITFYIDSPAKIFISGLNVYYLNKTNINSAYSSNKPTVFKFNTSLNKYGNTKYITLSNSLIRGSVNNFKVDLSNIQPFLALNCDNSIYSDVENKDMIESTNFSVSDSENITYLSTSNIFKKDNMVTVNMILKLNLDNIEHDKNKTINIGTLNASFRCSKALYTFGVLSSNQWYIDGQPVYAYISTSGSLQLKIDSSITGIKYLTLNISYVV